VGWIFHCEDAVLVNQQFDFSPVLLYHLMIGSHMPRLKAFVKTHPEITLIAGRGGLQFFE